MWVSHFLVKKKGGNEVTASAVSHRPKLRVCLEFGVRTQGRGVC